ncbi:hypothetical protein HY256_01280, partial [Candidatus Sumerlaeota bacterium]|nr:hypothetical protein [Candidatus Sumerlaeota bacterium]
MKVLTIAGGIVCGSMFPAFALKVAPLLPDQSARKERPGHDRRRFVAPEGFEVEEMASPDLVGSVVNMTFDYKGRPALAIENAGIVLLEDTDHDGKYDTKRDFCTDIKTAHGMHFIAPGDLIVNANGPQ